MKSSKFGFTVVEIMIVVAIMSLLVAIAVPNFIVAWRNKAIQAELERKILPELRQSTNLPTSLIYDAEVVLRFRNDVTAAVLSHAEVGNRIALDFSRKTGMAVTNWHVNCERNEEGVPLRAIMLLKLK